MGIEVGALHVRRSGFIRASPEHVWRELTSFDRMAACFGRGHRLEHCEPRWHSRHPEALRAIVEGEREEGTR